MNVKQNKVIMVIAVFMMIVFAGQIQAASVIDLAGPLTAGPTIQFSQDGVILDATSLAFNPGPVPAVVVQSALGLGVYSLGEQTIPEQIQVDGVDATEALVLSFDHVVKLEQILFSVIDQVGDEVRILDGDFNLLGDVVLSPGVNGKQVVSLNEVIGQQFAVTVTDPSDAYTVSALQFSVVPVPHAAWMGFGMLGSMMFSRYVRRRRAVTC